MAAAGGHRIGSRRALVSAALVVAAILVSVSPSGGPAGPVGGPAELAGGPRRDARGSAGDSGGSARHARAGRPAIRNADSPQAIRGEFVVALRGDAAGRGVKARAEALVGRYGGTVLSIVEILPGFGLRATDEQARRMAADPAVDVVEQNQRGELRDTQIGPDLPWHLDRIDQRPTALDGKYNHGFTSVPIYVIDSGVMTSHEEFEGRASTVFNATTGGDPDCSGHGTAVASVAAGRTLGVSKRSPIRAVKISDCVAGTNLLWMIEGLNFVALAAPRPAVANFSAGLINTNDTLLNQAAGNVVRTGMPLAIAASNVVDHDACADSPAAIGPAMDGAIVVGGLGRGDVRPLASSYGPCLSLFAPSLRLTVADIANPSATTFASGNSVAAPQVAAAAAMIVAQHPNYSAAQVEAAILADATPDTVADAGPGSPNRVLYIPPPDQPGTSAPSSDLNTMFRVYGDAGGHWTGGDETMSVKLPDGRVAWFFGDTMLGTVNADGSRPRGTPMIHNSVVVQDGNTLTQTLHGGTAAAPSSLVGSDAGPGNLGWWPGEGQVVGNELQVFYSHAEAGGGGALDIKITEIGIARFALPSLTLQGLTVLPALRANPSRAIGWGAAMADGVGTDTFTYVYGMERRGSYTHLYVARAPKGQVLSGSQWRFWTGSVNVADQWSSDESAAVSIMTGVGASFSVKYIEQYQAYTLVTFDESAPFSNRILAYSARQPTGPFRHGTQVYAAPEAGGNRWVYNARLHLEQNAGGATAVVSYNVNSFDPDELYNDARMYRPRFINATLPPALDASQLPNAPTNLTATSPADGQVRLSWTAPLQPNLRYVIYERKDAATQFNRVRENVTGTTLTFGVLTEGPYEYRVAAVNSVGEGPPSLPATVSVRLPAPASAPANLTASVNADGSVALGWQPVSAAGIVNYRVYQRDVTAGESFAISKTATVNGTTARVSGLAMGDTYEFTVTAFNGTGEGPRSNVARVTPTLPPPPAPTNLTATANGDGTIGLAWGSSGPGVWYWIYYRKVGEASFTRMTYPVSTGTTFTVSYLDNGQEYEFRVTAIGTDGQESAPSNTARATVRYAPPPTPTNLTATANGDGTIGLSWDSSGEGVWYWIYLRDVDRGQAFTRQEYPVANGTTLTVSYLEVGHLYEFRVSAIGPGSTESGQSNTARARSTVPPPGAPTNLRATAGNGQVTLNWNAPAPGTWYWVYMRNVSRGESFTRLTYPVTAGTTFTASFLTNGETYEFYVTAIGPGDTESSPSNAVQARPQVPPPSTPTGLTATSNSDGTIRLSWNSSGAGIWYWIYMRDAAGGSFTRLTYPVTTGTSFTAAYLTLNHTYEFFVTAINAGGESGPSNTARATATMPGPTGLVAWWEDHRAVYLSWNGDPNAYHFIYIRDVAAGGSFVRQPLPVQGRTWQIIRPLNSTAYEFYVTKAANGGETARSNIVSLGATYPLPSAGSLSVTMGASTPVCRKVGDYALFRCTSTVSTTARLADWNPNFRAFPNLNVEWRFTGGETDGNPIGWCTTNSQGVPPSSCQLTTARTATWFIWGNSPPANPVGPQVCIDTIAYATYLLDAHGNSVQRRRTYWACVTPGPPPA